MWCTRVRTPKYAHRVHQSENEQNPTPKYVHIKHAETGVTRAVNDGKVWSEPVRIM